MSLIFRNEPRRTAAVPLVPTTRQVEDAMEALAGGAGPFDLVTYSVSSALGSRIITGMRQAEAALLAAVADESVTTKAQAVECVRQATDGPFPAARFVDVIVANCGGTWTLALAAARVETGTE